MSTQRCQVKKKLPPQGLHPLTWEWNWPHESADDRLLHRTDSSSTDAGTKLGILVIPLYGLWCSKTIKLSPACSQWSENFLKIHSQVFKSSCSHSEKDRIDQTLYHDCCKYASHYKHFSLVVAVMHPQYRHGIVEFNVPLDTV